MPAGRVTQSGNRARRLFRGIDQLFGERAENAIVASKHFADLRSVFPGSFDHPAGGSVDHRGDPPD